MTKVLTQAIVLLAALVRVWAVVQLPVDFDEPVYLQAAFDYASALKTGDLARILVNPPNREHPALVKTIYAGAVLALGDNAAWNDALLASRTLSALFGTLAVLLLALLDPLAGALLAVQPLAVKYTSQAYLEALPLCASLASVVALLRSASPRDKRFWLSAVALGVTVAGKFTYLPIVLVLAYIAFAEKKYVWRNLLLYALLAAFTFLLLDPTLWYDPLARLTDALSFHVQYTQSVTVQRADYPWFQPLLWLAQSAPWHPDVFFYRGVDELVFLFALGGLYQQWRARRWVVVWLASSILILLLWQTKWPQYTLIAIPALCLAASASARELYRWVREQETYWNWLREMLPSPPRALWVITGALILLLVGGAVVNALQVSVGRLGWSHLTMQNTLLPNNTVYDLLALPNGQVWLATEGGAARWTAARVGDLPGTWRVFDTQDSGLPNDRVLALAQDNAGAIWFGTAGGLARYDGTDWRVYRGRDFGLNSDQVQALAFGNDGRLWIGTRAGAAVFDGKMWRAFAPGNSGLLDAFVLALAVEPAPRGDVIWFGTLEGVSRLNSATNEWTRYILGATDLGWGGVSDLMLDSSGRVWAATLGGGISVWDGAAWRAYRVGNTGLPFNTVNRVFESPHGIFWMATAAPNDVGGAVARFDGSAWQIFQARTSGFSGAEPLTLARDANGRLWIGTRTAGVDIYQPR